MAEQRPKFSPFAALRTWSRFLPCELLRRQLRAYIISWKLELDLYFNQDRSKKILRTVATQNLTNLTFKHNNNFRSSFSRDVTHTS